MLAGSGEALAQPSSQAHPRDLVCEYKTDPLGIDIRQPRLSWKITAENRDWTQQAYQLHVATTRGGLLSERDLVWDSGRVASGDSIHRPYQGAALRSSQRYYWRVRVWDETEAPSGWSDVAFWEMSLLDASDWTAEWITPGWEDDIDSAPPAPMLRRVFELDREVSSARMYITSLGLYEAEINGQRVGDQLFTPGWTAFRHRLQYQTYDVTSLLQRGANVIGATLGDGWYRGVIGFEKKRNYYGDRLGLLAQIRIEYADGQVETIGTDQQWTASTGAILASDIYMGEVYDARLVRPGWTTSDFDDDQVDSRQHTRSAREPPDRARRPSCASNG